VISDRDYVPGEQVKYYFIENYIVYIVSYSRCISTRSCVIKLYLFFLYSASLYGWIFSG